MTGPTAAFYDSDPEGYFDSTFGSDMSEIRGRFVSRMAPGARILDLGCGSCRDTVAFRRGGFEVVPADASAGMRRVVSERLGIDVVPLDFRDVRALGRFDGVWACASLLHVPSRELPEVLSGIRGALVPGGTLYCSFKLGSFEGVRDGRRYTDLVPGRLARLLEDAGFASVETWVSGGGRGPWCNALAAGPRRLQGCLIPVRRWGVHEDGRKGGDRGHRRG